MMTETVRQHAAEQGIAVEEALKQGVKAKPETVRAVGR
jgi:hypothetical protein